jgi:hypothetical protein
MMFAPLVESLGAKRPATAAPIVQSKLRVGDAQGPLEREADRIADQVMRGPAAGTVQPSAPLVQRACTACKQAEEETLHRKRTDEDDEVLGKLVGPAPAIPADLERDIRSLSGGAPLPPASRAFFEPRFGHDFARVRVHDGGVPGQLATRLNSRAFTHGANIVFAAGEFAPGTAGGQHLLAHELTHVVQQGHASQQSMPAPAFLVQRDLATPPPAVPPAAQPDLTPDQIRRALRFNQATYDEIRTKQIQDLVGTTPTGTWVEEDILAIARLQEEYGLKKDGMVGPNSFDFLDKETRAEGLDKTDENCMVAFHVAVDPTTVGPVAGGRCSITGHFTMRAQFSKYCNCADYQYRQFIRGHWRRIRAGVTTDLAPLFTNFPGGGGLPTNFAEDGNTASAAVNYGHRDQANEGLGNGYFDDSAGTTANQRSGCHYLGHDTPGGPVAVLTGDVFEILLAFRGEIRRRGKMVTEQYWTAINGRFPVP